NETLAALDHPAIRHVYAAGFAGGFAYRTANWVDGESLADALRRGPRPIPTAHALVRDLLGGLEHAHARGVIMRRIVPTTLLVEVSGRAVITDLRYANWCLAEVPPEERGAGGAFVAPEVRAGGMGEPASDVYTVAAIVYYTITGQEPDPDPAKLIPPRRMRRDQLRGIGIGLLACDGVVDDRRHRVHIARRLPHAAGPHLGGHERTARAALFRRHFGEAPVGVAQIGDHGAPGDFDYQRGRHDPAHDHAARVRV